jgi:hypothetical protein
MPLNGFVLEVANEPVFLVASALAAMIISEVYSLQLAMPLIGFVPDVADEPVFPSSITIDNPLITLLATHTR